MKNKEKLKAEVCKTIRGYQDPSGKPLYLTYRIGIDLADYLLTSLEKQGIIIVSPDSGQLYEIVKNVYGKEE